MYALNWNLTHSTRYCLLNFSSTTPQVLSIQTCTVYFHLTRLSLHVRFGRLLFLRMDIIFDHCEFENVHLNQCSLSRVHFISCRISGMELSQSLVQDTLFQLCKGHYCDFGGSTFKDCMFDINDLTGSGFVQCDFKKTSFDKCILNSTEWFNTKLKELDFSSCEIENIALSSDKLTGVVVNSSQALEFVRLLGIVVKD